MFENNETGGFGALTRGGLGIEENERSLDAPVSHCWKLAATAGGVGPPGDAMAQSPVLEIDAESGEHTKRVRELTRGSRSQLLIRKP